VSHCCCQNPGAGISRRSRYLTQAGYSVTHKSTLTHRKSYSCRGGRLPTSAMQKGGNPIARHVRFLCCSLVPFTTRRCTHHTLVCMAYEADGRWCQRAESQRVRWLGLGLTTEQCSRWLPEQQHGVTTVSRREVWRWRTAEVVTTSSNGSAMQVGGARYY
jgi:hypothetical protein